MSSMALFAREQCGNCIDKMDREHEQQNSMEKT